MEIWHKLIQSFNWWNNCKYFIKSSHVSKHLNLKPATFSETVREFFPFLMVRFPFDGFFPLWWFLFRTIDGFFPHWWFFPLMVSFPIDGFFPPYWFSPSWLFLFTLDCSFSLWWFLSCSFDDSFSCFSLFPPAWFNLRY